MKRFLLPLLILWANLLFGSHETPIADAKIISEEIKFVNGILAFKLNISTYSKNIQINKIKSDLPNGWKVLANAGCLSIPKNSNRKINIVIKYNKSSIPFYPQQISFEYEYKVSGDTTKRFGKMEGRVFFTPYNTVEIFNDVDFSKLNRVWYSDGGTKAIRKYIAKSKIPVSDLNITTDTIGGIDMESIPVRLVHLEGLAYTVPMKLQSNDVYLEDFDDGQDSVYVETQAEADSLSAAIQRLFNGVVVTSYQMKGASTNNKSLFGIKIKWPKIKIHINLSTIIPAIPILTRNFRGTVTGRLTTIIVNDLGQEISIPQTGIFVALHERNLIVDELLGYTHTDQNGYYSISYNTNQFITEGQNIEPYLKFKSKNEIYDIKAKRHSVLGSAYDFIYEIGHTGQNPGTINRNVVTYEDAFKAVHYATRAWKFNQQNSISIPSGLTLLPYSGISAFSPDGFIVSSPLLEPTIRLESGEAEENTVFHEFGHFMMWRIQGNRGIANYALKCNGEHSWDEENTTYVAWSEGWAAAHSMILDLYYWQEDGEYGFDDGKLKPLKEIRNNYPNISNGFLSEYYIACAIYDLYDRDFGQPESMFSIRENSNYNVGYKDNVNTATKWLFEDNVSYSYYEIVRPFNQGCCSEMIKSVKDYIVRFHNQHGKDCSVGNDLFRTFTENRVVKNISEFTFNKNLSYSSYSLDNVGDTYNYSQEGCANGLPHDIEESFAVNFNQTYFHVNAQAYQIWKENDFSFFENFTLSVTANLKYLNAGAHLNPSVKDGVENPVFETCGPVKLQFENTIFHIGGANSPASLTLNEKSLLNLGVGATLIINENSSILVKASASLLFKAGVKIKMLKNSKIYFENGAYLCIDPSTIFEVDPTASFVFYGSVNSGVLSNWDESGNCSTTAPPVCIIGGNYSFSAEALLFDGYDDWVEIPETNGRLNLGTGDFTMEAIIKAEPDNVQAIISKRTFASGDDANGYIFGLMDDNTLFMQLEGTPNHGAGYGPNLADGLCHHVAVVRQSGVLKFYADGQNYYTTTSTGNISSGGTTRIGRNHISGLPFNGLIGEVRIWNIARTDAEIINSIGLNLTAQTGLIGYWDMNEMSSSQLIEDLSTNNPAEENHGIRGSSAVTDENDPILVQLCGISCGPGSGNQSNFRNIEFQGLETSEQISLYPNPFDNELTIDLTHSGQSDELVEISVYNTNGIAVHQEFVKTGTINKLRLDAENGLYLVKVKTGKELRIFKVVHN